MESGGQNIFHKLSVICEVMPYYGYLDKAVRFLRSVNRESNYTLELNYNAILNGVKKRVIFIKYYFTKQIERALIKGNKYKLYKFNIFITNNDYLNAFGMFFFNHPEMELEQIYGWLNYGTLNSINKLYRILSELPYIKSNPQKISEILDFEYSHINKDVSKVKYLPSYKLNDADCNFPYLERCNELILPNEPGEIDINVNYNKVGCSYQFCQKIDKIIIDNQDFITSLTSIKITGLLNSKFYDCFKKLKAKFVNLKHFEGDFGDAYIQIEDVQKILSMLEVRSVGHNTSNGVSIKFESELISGEITAGDVFGGDFEFIKFKHWIKMLSFQKSDIFDKSSLDLLIYALKEGLALQIPSKWVTSLTISHIKYLDYLEDFYPTRELKMKVSKMNKAISFKKVKSYIENIPNNVEFSIQVDLNYAMLGYSYQYITLKEFEEDLSSFYHFVIQSDIDKINLEIEFNSVNALCSALSKIERYNMNKIRGISITMIDALSWPLIDAITKFKHKIVWDLELNFIGSNVKIIEDYSLILDHHKNTVRIKLNTTPDSSKEYEYITQFLEVHPITHNEGVI